MSILEMTMFAVTIILLICLVVLLVKEGNKWKHPEHNPPAKNQRVLVYRGFGELIILTSSSKNWHTVLLWTELPELP